MEKTVLVVEPLEYNLMTVINSRFNDVRVFQTRMPDAASPLFARYLQEIEKFVDDAVEEKGDNIALMSAGRAFLVAYVATLLLKKGISFELLVWSPDKKKYVSEKVGWDEK